MLTGGILLLRPCLNVPVSGDDLGALSLGPNHRTTGTRVATTARHDKQSMREHGHIQPQPHFVSRPETQVAALFLTHLLFPPQTLESVRPESGGETKYEQQVKQSVS